jgi:hypothetical protein
MALTGKKQSEIILPFNSKVLEQVHPLIIQDAERKNIHVEKISSQNLHNFNF